MLRHSNINSANGPFLTQREKLRALMFSREGQWVPLPDVQALGIAQHGARFKELREELEPQGYQIKNRMEHGTDGIVRSWYMLTRCTPISPKCEEIERKRPASETRHARAERFSREFGLRPAPHPWKAAFSEKRLSQDDCFVLTPPEPHG